MARRTAVLLTLVLVAIVGFVVLVMASSSRPATSDFTASNVTPEPSQPVPDDPCHRGGVTYCALNPAVTQATIQSTICVSGWTASIRLPESYTEPLKLQQIATEGLTGMPSEYEEDHRMPLELGGEPRAITNLSPESHATSHAKDAAENEAKREVCAGADLRTVQTAFVAAWLGPYPAYVT